MPCILLVTNKESQERNGVALALELAGYECRVVDSAAEAALELRSSAVDLIVCHGNARLREQIGRLATRLAPHAAVLLMRSRISRAMLRRSRSDARPRAPVQELAIPCSVDEFNQAIARALGSTRLLVSA